jgi:hypothetical protein
LTLTAAPGNVRALRPISILVASNDDPFSGRLVDEAGASGVPLSRVPADANLEVALAESGANVLLLDVGDALGRGARRVTAFAALHPDVPVVVAADRPAAPTLCGVPMLDKWRSTERLLAEIELAYLGLWP